MDVQVAVNTLLSIMALVFPGFLFRRFYYRGEFTKQFGQTKQVDALVLNVVFSIFLIWVTILLVKFFAGMNGFRVLESLTYDSISSILQAFLTQKMPSKDIIIKTYRDVIFLSVSIYTISIVLGWASSFVVVSLGLDKRFNVLRFKNYWYYYIHGGSILYHEKPRKWTLTVADVLCDVGNGTKLYSGIISQYTINSESNGLEQLFLTDAHRFKGSKTEDNLEKVRIPGSVMCIPGDKILNINLSYLTKPANQLSRLHFYHLFVSLVFIAGVLSLTISLFFDLNYIGVDTAFKKVMYVLLGLPSLASMKTVIDVQIPFNRPKFIASLFTFIMFSDWFRYTTNLGESWNTWWVHVIITLVCLVTIGLNPQKSSNKVDPTP